MSDLHKCFPLMYSLCKSNWLVNLYQITNVLMSHFLTSVSAECARQLVFIIIYIILSTVFD